jgi:hypothetical protein
MRRYVLAAGIAMLVVAGCSKPTELASEANARYDRRDPVVAPPAVGEDVDTTPVEPTPGSPEAEALPGEEALPAEAQPLPGEVQAPVETTDPAAPPTAAETLAPPVETLPPVTETPALPAPTEPAAPAPAAPVSPPAETPPAPAPN